MIELMKDRIQKSLEQFLVPAVYRMIMEKIEALIHEVQTSKNEHVQVLWTPTHQSYFSAGDEAEPYCGRCETYLQDDFKFCPGCGSSLDWGDKS